MRIKLVSVLITLLMASAVMFAGCIEKDKSTKVSEITASPASTPIILPTSTPTSTPILTTAVTPVSTPTPAQITPATSAPIPTSVPEVAYDKIGDVMSNKAAYNNKIIKIKGQVDTIHIPTRIVVLVVTAVLTEGIAPIDIGDSVDLYAMMINEDTGWMNVWILKSIVDEKGIEYGDTIELVGAFYYIQEKYPCQACGGDGVFGEDVTCLVCGGTGKCGVCGGDGNIDCAVCGGTGKVLGIPCVTCEGRGWVGCGACGGWFESMGSGKCGICGGDGAVIEESTCSLCGGTGVVNLENPLIPQEFQADYVTWVKNVQKV